MSIEVVYRDNSQIAEHDQQIKYMIDIILTMIIMVHVSFWYRMTRTHARIMRRSLCDNLRSPSLASGDAAVA